MKIFKLLFVGLIILSFTVCSPKSEPKEFNVRAIIDTIGFVQYDWQMDSIMSRLNTDINVYKKWRVAITPHDDYAYVGDLYPKILNGIKAKTVILFGVAHKARNYNLENKIVFGSFDAWSAPYGNVPVSELRNELIEQMPDSLYVVHNEMQSVEHSLEALVPFLQYNNRNTEIIPVLVPYMTLDKMMEISKSFSDILSKLMKSKDLSWGDDVAIVITTDAVHYGDEDWGGKNYAPFGTDESGLLGVKNFEMEIINTCLVGEVTPSKIEKFTNYTVQEYDYKEYKWTWCGRYSVPFGLLTSYYLNKSFEGRILKGDYVGYTTSIDHPKLNVEDLNMGTTAPANNHHFVGYAAVSYE